MGEKQERNDKHYGALLLVSTSYIVARWGKKYSCISTGFLEKHSASPRENKFLYVCRKKI